MTDVSKVLFIDLDGTIIETKSGMEFPKDRNDWKFKVGILDKLGKYYLDGYKIHIVTNQAGIDKGYILPVDFSYKIDSIVKQISAYLLICERSYFNLFIIDHLRIMANEISITIAPSFSSRFRKPKCDWVKEVYSNLSDDSLMVGDASGEIRLRIVDGPTVSYIDEEEKAQVFHVDNIKKALRNSNPNSETRSILKELPIIEKDGDLYEKIMDHSDVDKKFADNLGIKYIDIEEFLNDEKEETRAEGTGNTRDE